MKEEIGRIGKEDDDDDEGPEGPSTTTTGMRKINIQTKMVTTFSWLAVAKQSGGGEEEEMLTVVVVVGWVGEVLGKK